MQHLPWLLQVPLQRGRHQLVKCSAITASTAAAEFAVAHTTAAATSAAATSAVFAADPFNRFFYSYKLWRWLAT